jgi:hypothetical protein
LAHNRWLHAERRVREAPYGGSYFSGLHPETDLLVYDGPEFLQVEIKDYARPIGRFEVTELWARALDLHLGRASLAWDNPSKDQHVILIAAGGADDSIRIACLRWGICLVEPDRVPILTLAGICPDIDRLCNQSGTISKMLAWACLPLNRRAPMAANQITISAGPFRNEVALRSLLKFQKMSTAIYHRAVKTCPAAPST